MKCSLRWALAARRPCKQACSAQRRHKGAPGRSHAQVLHGSAFPLPCVTGHRARVCDMQQCTPSSPFRLRQRAVKSSAQCGDQCLPRCPHPMVLHQSAHQVPRLLLPAARTWYENQECLHSCPHAPNKPYRRSSAPVSGLEWSSLSMQLHTDQCAQEAGCLTVCACESSLHRAWTLSNCLPAGAQELQDATLPALCPSSTRHASVPSCAD